MNLHLHINNKPVNLYQTPTHITDMCMTNDRGVVQEQVKGGKAIGVLHRYRHWRLEQLRSNWYHKTITTQEYLTQVNELADFLTECSQPGKKLHFFIM